MRRFFDVTMMLAIILAIVAIWEVSVRVFRPPVILLPAPSRIWTDFWEAPSYFLRNTFYTFATTLAGFALAVLLGIVLAVAIVSSRFLDRVITTMLVLLNSLPKVALAPLFVIWMGLGMEPKVAIAVMLAIFVTVADTVMGFRSVDPDAIALARVNQASAWRILVKLRLPSALPAVFVSMKVATSLALVGAIVGEFVGGSTGLGFVILTAQGQFDTSRVFVALILLGLLGTVLYHLVELAERVAVPWHVSQRSRSGGH